MSAVVAITDDLDRGIMLATQAGLPLVSRPYALLARQLGIEEREVCSRMAAMLEDGRMRRIGAVPNHYRLGYGANGMSVWDLSDEDVDAAGEEVGRLEFVSHCYRRPRHLPQWPYNLFAMVHAKSSDEVHLQVDQIAALLGNRVRSFEVLFSKRILKKTGLRIGV